MPNDAEDVRRIAREKAAKSEAEHQRRTGHKEPQRIALEKMRDDLNAIIKNIPEVAGYYPPLGLYESEEVISFNSGVYRAYRIESYGFQCWYDPIESLYLTSNTQFTSSALLSHGGVVRDFKIFLGSWVHVSLPSVKKDRNRYNEEKNAKNAKENAELFRSILWLLVTILAIFLLFRSCVHPG